jgi:hypothetical protein
MSGSAGFDTYNFAANEDWKRIEDNLYFSSNDAAENARVLLKRKRKWYLANVDNTAQFPEEQSQQTYGNRQEEQRQKEEAERQKPKPAASESPRSSVPPPSSSGTSSGVKSKYAIYISWVQLALHTLQILLSIAYILPILGVEFQTKAFTYVMMLSLAAQGIYLLRQYGRPRWNAEYGRQIFMDEQAHFLFLSLVLLNANASLILLLPFFARSLLFVAGGVKQLLPKASPKLYGLVQKPVEKLVDMYSWIYSTNALLEVLAGFTLIVQLLTPARNFMMLLGVWQYLRVRYMLSADSKRAFGTVRAKIDGWLSAPMVPGAIRAGWAKLLTTLEGMTDQEAMARQAEQGGGGLMSKCSIM